jgi:ATP-binding cassette subfamily C (CFTR/MRP) protein 1
MAVIPRLCLIGFNFAQPFLITAALNLVSEPVNPSTRNEGYGLIGATALIYLGIAVGHSNRIVSTYLIGVCR